MNKEVQLFKDYLCMSMHDAFPAYCFINVWVWQECLVFPYPKTAAESPCLGSHSNHLLHQVTGRRDRAKPLPFKVETSGPWGFAGANDDNPRISAKFVAPCYYMNK